MSVFKKISEHKILHKGEYFYIIKDKYPVSPGHLLIITKEERIDFFALNQNERYELTNLILIAKEIIEKQYKPEGYNLGMNCGELAGQTVMHFHCHVIPRFKGDMKNPKGGIRHAVWGKGYY